MSEGGALIIKNKSTEIQFDEKMANHSSEGFLLTTKFYKSAKGAALLAPKKRNPEGDAFIHLEGTVVNSKKQTTTKTSNTGIHASELHTKHIHPREERMSATAKHIHYSVKGQ